MIRRSLVIVAMLALTGATFAQEPAPPAAHWHGEHQWKNSAEWRQKMEQHRMERLTVLLELTAAQRQQVQAILSDEHAKMRTAMQQVEQAMQKARATHEAVHKEAIQRLSSVLTPAQMKKLNVLMPEHGMMMHGMMMHGMMMHGMMMHGMGDGMSAPPPPGSSGPQ
jgi:glycyl-tRNA synthetase beta subunit